ncbi:extensin-like [Ixodes scapularis]|uniref:extensin-like n=1 Tax=Ixodes scapularis TaxID=6945 RepID=UPI001A9F37AE|nr:extensin-like [Ixodes scapularis]
MQPLTALVQDPGRAIFSGPLQISDSLPEPPQDSPIMLQQQTYSVLEPLPHAVHQSMPQRRTSLPVPLPVLQFGARLDSHLESQLESSSELQLKSHLGSRPKPQPKTKLIPQRPPPPPPQALRPVCQRRPPRPEPRAEVHRELYPEPPPERHLELQLISERPTHPNSEPMPQSQPIKLVPQPLIHSYVQPCVQALQTEPPSELHLEPRLILQGPPAQSAAMPQKRAIKPGIQPEVQSEPQSYVQPDAVSDLQPEPCTEPLSESHLEPQLILERLPLSSPQPEPQGWPSEVAPEPELQPELQSYVQPGVISELLLEPHSEPHTESHLEPQLILEPPPLPSLQPEPRSRPIQPAPRLKLQPGLQPNAQANPQPETQPEPHLDSHAQSQPEPISAPRRLPPPMFEPGSRQTAEPSEPGPESVSEPLPVEPETPGPPPQRPPRRLRRRGVDDSSAFHDGRPRRPVQGDSGQEPQRLEDVTEVLRPPPRGIPVVRRPSERPGSAARPFGKPASGAAEQRPPH